ncbi:MAG: lipopolysaccharide heptosyltransferase II [Firmicutes bacterium]|nr:lipopolysaccharide heptosyltransferase II [Bacillota bacterium]
MNRILVIKNKGGIGDALVSTPVFTNLKKRFPGCKITLLASPYNEEIFKGNPYIDEIIVDRGQVKGFKPFEFWRLRNLMARRKFDAAIILWDTARSAWLCYLAGVPLRVGKGNSAISRKLLNKIAEVRSEEDHKSHWLEFLLDHIRTLGIECNLKELVLVIPPEAGLYVDELLKKNGIKKDEKVIGIHPGKGLPELHKKKWPRKLFAGISIELHKKFPDAKIIFTGSPGEVPLVKEIVKMADNSVIDLSGRTGVMELACLISRCSFFICPDSGPMHLAAAVKTPVVAIYALNSDLPFRWYPYDVEHYIVHKEGQCRKQCIKETCRDFTCLEVLTVEDVMAGVEKLSAKNS